MTPSSSSDSPVSRLGRSMPARRELVEAGAAGRRPARRRSWATARVGRPGRCRASAQPAGFSPPALDTTTIPSARQVPSTCSIWVRKVVAKPRSGSLQRALGQDEHGQLGQPVAGQDVDGPAARPSRGRPTAGRRRSRCSWPRAGARVGCGLGRRARPRGGGRGAAGAPGCRRRGRCAVGSVSYSIPAAHLRRAAMSSWASGWGRLGAPAGGLGRHSCALRQADQDLVRLDGVIHGHQDCGTTPADGARI